MKPSGAGATHTMPKLDLGRSFPADVPANGVASAAQGMREAWVADGVMHGEVLVDPRQWADAIAGLRAIDAGLRADGWSYALVVRVDAPWPELTEAVADAELSEVRGILTANPATLGALWGQVRAAGWMRLVEANTPEQIAAALDAGCERVVGCAGLGAKNDGALVAHLRAHRIPVMVSPTAQIQAGHVAGWGQHPLRALHEAGVLTTVGSGWPASVGATLSEELDHISRHLHWRLDDLRSLMARNAESALVAANLRFGLARQIEAWRHRPHAAAPAKGDGWSL